MFEELYNRPFDVREIADQYRINLDQRSPKIRLTVIMYLLENGIKPNLDDPESFIEMARLLAIFVGEELEDFVNDIETIADRRESMPTVNIETKKDGESDDDGHLYL